MGNGDDRERSRSRGKPSERDKGSARDRDRESATEERRRSGTGRRRGDEDDDDSASKRRRSGSPPRRHSRHSKPRSPSPRHRSRRDDERPSSREEDHGNDQANNNGNDVDDSVAKMQAAEEALQAKQKEKPSFELSGKLAAETNRVRGVTLLFNEPPDAGQPTVRWRLYVFKNGEAINEPLYIHRQSCYLFGRERRVADIPTDHPSCSKQHAVIQYRKVEKEKPDGMLSKQVRPYIMDLGSTNKTFINESPIEPQRYYELHEQDTIKFGNSSREYVLLHENSAA